MIDYARVDQHLTRLARITDVDPDTILSPSRKANAAQARLVLYWLLRSDGHSLPTIGRLLERDHTTVLSGINRVDNNPELLALAWEARAA